MNFRLFILFALAIGALFGTGCETVKPWQRATLADYTMRANEHVFLSREEASGGTGVGGGGCGCN